MIEKIRISVPVEAPTWARALARDLDGFVTNVARLLARRLAQIDDRDVLFTVPSGAAPWSTGDFPLVIKPTFEAKPRGVFIGRCVKDGIPVRPTALSWEIDTAGAVRITGIEGLTAGAKYTLTVIMLG